MSRPREVFGGVNNRGSAKTYETGRARRRRSNGVGLACRAILERLEDRRLLSGDIRLIGITGNQGSANPDPVGHPDETLWQISVGAEGSHDITFLDGFSDVPNPPDTVLSISTSVGVTHGAGALRVEVPQDSGAYWGFMSPNVINLLRDGASELSYDMTLNNVELNGGSFGGGADNSFIGFAHSDVLAVQINTQDNGFIQRDFTAGGGDDSLGQDGRWQGVDGTRHIRWDLNQFTSEGMLLQDFIAAHNPTEAHFWFLTQGGFDTNGHTGPMRFYFDNFKTLGPAGEATFGDFNLVSISQIKTLPFVPDTDSIGFNPDSGLLHRLSGSETYSNSPTSNGYRDNQFMETVDVNALGYPEAAIFNANSEGNQNGPFGIPAPRPDWVLPAERRTDTQTNSSYRIRGPNEYHALRDLTWSTDEHLFYGSDETGIYKLTADGHSTFVGRPIGVSGNPKGITFHTFAPGDRRLLISERDGPMLWRIDPATGQTIDSVFITDPLGSWYPGVLSLVDDPTGPYLYAIAKPVGNAGDPFARELIRIDPNTGQAQSLGALGTDMADLAFIVPTPSVTNAEFLYENAPQRVSITFDQRMEFSLASEDITVEKLGDGGGPVSFDGPVYDPATNTATVSFSSILPDGNYRLTLNGSGVTNDLNMALAQNQVVDFFVLSGDLNRDRTVSIADFINLASHFNQPTTKWSDGDLNYDGTVTIADFIALAASFNKVLDPPLPAAPPQQAAALSISASASGSDDGLALASSADVTDSHDAPLFTRTVHKKHAHHKRRGHTSARHWISRSGAY